MTLDAPRTGWVTLRSKRGERAVFDDLDFGPNASYIAVRGVTVAGRVDLLEEGGHHIKLLRSGLGGVKAMWGTHDLEIAANRIDYSDSGIELISQNCSVHGAPPCDPVVDFPPVKRVRIAGNRIVAPAKNGITISNYRDVTIERNDISGLVEQGQHSDAIQSFFGGADLVIRGNHIHDNVGTQGIFIKDGRVTNVTITGNLIARTTARPGFSYSGPPLSFYDSHGIKITHNTIWDNRHQMAILGPDNRRIVIQGNVTQGILRSEASRRQVLAGGVEQDYNLVGGGNWGAVGRHDVRGRPRFRDRRAGDYRLTRRLIRKLGFWPGVRTNFAR